MRFLLFSLCIPFVILDVNTYENYPIWANKSIKKQEFLTVVRVNYVCIAVKSKRELRRINLCLGCGCCQCVQ